MSAHLVTLAPALGGAAAAGLAVFLFLELRKANRDFQARWQKRQQLVQTEIGRMRSEMAELTARVEESERRAAILVHPPQQGHSINLNRRAEAIRLHQRGESPEQIAASLRLSMPEVRLVLKVHRIRLDAKSANAQRAP